ncbi:uncharacterized protein LOC132803768 [Ziziphus jujuba]|uniref:Uncharacterized protein LOC132803768 n=1 Tax=Ziziphus jujuba TaxID=326968 RepID=A0ABM4A956_ZIZJJ|nr:uncharacterized protein LOC132803768 [Ziziphus jujuba]
MPINMFSCILLEHIWWIRNRVMHGKDIESLEFSMQTITIRFNEIKDSISHDLMGRPTVSSINSRQGWSRPTVGTFKINTDAALSKRGSCLAMVVRNAAGNILHIRSFKSVIDIPDAAEMEAILKALQVAYSYGWSNICLESDASAVIDSLATKNRKAFHWQAEHLANLIFQLTHVSFVWTARENNRCAHLVGQWAKKFSFFGEVDLYSLPPYFVSLLIQESDRGVAT